MDIKLDARNLIEADVKSALTDLDWFGKAGAPRFFFCFWFLYLFAMRPQFNSRLGGFHPIKVFLRMGAFFFVLDPLKLRMLFLWLPFEAGVSLKSGANALVWFWRDKRKPTWRDQLFTL